MEERVRLTTEALQAKLQADYQAYSEAKSDSPLAIAPLNYWKDYFDVHPDQVEVCVTVLLSLEKERQLAVPANPKFQRTPSQVFLRNSERNLAVSLLLYTLCKIDDPEYIQLQKNYAKHIEEKRRELNLDDLSDSELNDPDSIDSLTRQSTVIAFKRFLEDLPHPLLNSKKFEILLRYFASVDLQDIKWIDKAYVLVAQSHIKSGATKNNFKPLGEKAQAELKEKYRLFRFEFLHGTKIQKTLEQITLRTEKYSADLDQEITDEITEFFEDNPGYWLKLTLDNGQQILLYQQHAQLKIGTEVANLPVKDGKINGLTITSAKEFIPERYDSFRNHNASAKFIDEKFHIRHQIGKLHETLQNPKKSALEKIQTFSETLFVKPEQQSAPLAKQIESTKTGFDYVKDVAAIITSGIAFASILGIIPMIAYRYKAHKWLWESHRGNLLDDAKAAEGIRAQFNQAYGTR